MYAPMDFASRLWRISVAGTPHGRPLIGRLQRETMTQEHLTFTFHCAAEDGAWLGFEGPILLEPEAVMGCVAALLAGVRGCHEVSVWVDDQHVLTACGEASELVMSS